MSHRTHLVATLTAALLAGTGAGADLPRGDPLPRGERYRIGPDVDPLGSASTLRHPTKGRLDAPRGDPLDELPFRLKYRWKELQPYFDTSSDVVLSSLFRGFFESCAKEAGPEILPALLQLCQEALLTRAREALEARRQRVRQRRALDEARRQLELEVRREAARARRHGRSARDDGRVRRARARLRLLQDQRRRLLGSLPEAELTLPRLARRRDELVQQVRRRVSDLHSAAGSVLRMMR